MRGAEEGAEALCGRTTEAERAQEGMSEGNVLFLVCTPCSEANQPDFGVKIAIRSRVGFYEHCVPDKQFDTWLMKHAKCGGRAQPDHYQLAHQFDRNHDQQKVKDAVKLAVVN